MNNHERQVHATMPAEIVAAVFLRWDSDGNLIALYGEHTARVPAPRRQVAEALARLAGNLERQADELDRAGSGS